MSAADPIIPFGKFKGCRCSEIDDVRYLDWLVGQDWLANCGPDLKEKIEEHLQSRADWQQLGNED